MNPTLVRRTRHAHRFGRWPNVGFKNPTYADDAAELLLFCKVIFRIGMTHKCRLKLFSDGIVLFSAFKAKQRNKPVGRILESDTCSQNKARTSLWPMAKRRIQESDLRGWCCRTAFIWQGSFFEWVSDGLLSYVNPLHFPAG